MVEVLIALIISLSAVACIYWSWRQQGRWLFACAGWLLALVSLLTWSAASGPEFGVTYAIIGFACFAWMFAASGLRLSGADGRTSVRSWQALQKPAVNSVLKSIARFLLSVPATGVLSLMLSVALVLYLPWELLTRMAAAIILYPLLWGGFSAWICAQEGLARSVMVMGCLFLISSLVLFI